jgi:type I restriction enzyme S subunit
MSNTGNNWQSRPLGELATTTSGGTPSRTRKDYYGGSIPWVKSGELNDDYIFDTEEHITEAGLKNSSAKVFSSGTVLIALYGATVGKTSILRTDASTNQAVCGITPGPDLDAGYLRFHLISLRRELLSHRYGGAQPNISQQIVRNQRIAYPPLPEQKKIAHILSTVQRATEAQERIIQTTTELKKALMHKLFTEGLRHERQKQTEIGPVPESWATPTVESVCTIKASAMSYSQLENASNVANGVNVIGIKVSDMNLPGNEIEFRSANLERQLPEKEALKRTVPTNSIVFPKRGAAIATNKKRLTTGWTVLDPNLIAVMPTKVVNHRYLFHWFNTFDLKKITDPGPTPQLNKKDIAPLKFPMPPVEEQEAIAAAIDAAEEKATLHSRKRDQFQDLFRTLLHELMTAKTRVQDLLISV